MMSTSAGQLHLGHSLPLTIGGGTTHARNLRNDVERDPAEVCLIVDGSGMRGPSSE
jgi:hypothetical protein